jgi:isopenicillin N synthase-like dioxygenase
MKLAMENKPFFTGCTALGNEIRAKAKDAREPFDFVHEHAFDWKKGDQNWRKMRRCVDQVQSSQSLSFIDQWPPSQLLPEFRPAMETYLNEVTLLSRRILHLAADGLDLPAAMFDKYVCSHKKHQGVNDDMILLLHCRLIHNYLIR